MNNPLDGIMDWYQTANDSMRVMRRVIEKDPKGLVTRRHVFHGLPFEESSKRLEGSIRELQNVVVLALVAVFERVLREHIVGLLQTALRNGDPLQEKIREQVEEDVEYWQFSERLVDAFEAVSSEDRGNVKQLIDFRNWVAHGHFLAKPAPLNAEPRSVYRLLTSFLRDARIVS